MKHVLLCIAIVFFLNFRSSSSQKKGNPSLNLLIPEQASISDSVPPECWNFTHGNPSKMEFFSPNFPGDYPNNVNCARYIEAPQGYRIHLDFREWFKIEGSENCEFDFLLVRDGPFGYSPVINKLCGKEFPSKVITSTTRFMWLQFKSDKNLGDKGFKATYSFKAIDDGGREGEKKVCRIHYNDRVGPEGEITTDIIPIADTSSPGYPVNTPIDCTWEIDSKPNSRIRISEISTYFHGSSCNQNYIEIFDGSTLSKDTKVKNCGHGPFVPYDSASNKVFVRIFSSSLNTKPDLKLLFTKFMYNDTCNARYLSCDGRCISRDLVCNGMSNCPNGMDEEGCDTDESGDKVVDDRNGRYGHPKMEDGNSGLEGVVESLPLHAIIIGAVGGVLGTIIVIGVCLVCRYQSQKRKKQRQEQRDKLKENFEMSNINTNTNLLTKKSSAQPNYYSLPRQPRGQREYTRRDSNTNSSVPSEGDVPDHNSDPGNYKKYMVMDQYLEEEPSPVPSVYSQGPVLTTIIERHDIPPQHQQEIDGSYGWTGYGWKQPQSDAKPSMSLTENLAKLAQYNIPQKAYSPDYKVHPSDPKYELYPELRFKDYARLKYGQQGPELTSPTKEQQKPFKISSQHPDITRDLEVT